MIDINDNPMRERQRFEFEAGKMERFRIKSLCVSFQDNKGYLSFNTGVGLCTDENGVYNNNKKYIEHEYEGAVMSYSYKEFEEKIREYFAQIKLNKNDERDLENFLNQCYQKYK